MDHTTADDEMYKARLGSKTAMRSVLSGRHVTGVHSTEELAKVTADVFEMDTANIRGDPYGATDMFVGLYLIIEIPANKCRDITTKRLLGKE